MVVDSNGIEKRICQDCVNSTKSKELNKLLDEHKNKLQKEKEFEIERSKNKYNFLCFIGEDRWGSYVGFADFFAYEYNQNLLNNELDRKGYDVDTEWDIRMAMESNDVVENLSVYSPDSIMSEKLYPNTMWLYINMRKAKINTGTYLDFKRSLSSEEGFVWYFNKSIEMGLVDSWYQFVMLMFEPDEDICKELWMDKWKEDESEDY